MQDDAGGWAALDHGSALPAPLSPEILKAFARGFSGPDGDLILNHLRALTLDRALGPAASAAEIRHLEGQRCLVRQIETLIARGRAAP
ncbi:MAG: hypothetical protein R8L07_02955 [Alphaproteobacteria bacterium]|nr:hypothetical protein [Alphaproteobacteria bacterium]